jgi:glucose-1-phosphate cytidylyltransferase
MQTVILCGGLGTRMREETEYRPKPLVPIGGKPVLWHIMKMYAEHGFRDFVLPLGYRGDMIKDYFLNYETSSTDFTITLGQKPVVEVHNDHDERGFKVTLVDTGQPTLTGGRVKRVQKYITDDTFMVTYGDGVSDIDLTGLVDFHRSHGKLATITAVRPTSRFGLMDITPEGAVSNFEEKPEMDVWASAGFMVFERRVFDYLPGDDCILEQEPLMRLAQEGELHAYRHSGAFYAMDTLRDVTALNKLWDAGEASWKTWE